MQPNSKTPQDLRNIHTLFSQADAHRHEQVFDALTEMTRAFVRLIQSHDGVEDVVATLDHFLAKGWMLKTQFSIGGAGALGCSLAAVSPAGVMTEIVCIDAAPSSTPFRLHEVKSVHDKK